MLAVRLEFDTRPPSSTLTCTRTRLSWTPEGVLPHVGHGKRLPGRTSDGA